MPQEPAGPSRNTLEKHDELSEDEELQRRSQQYARQGQLKPHFLERNGENWYCFRCLRDGSQGPGGPDTSSVIRSKYFSGCFWNRYGLDRPAQKNNKGETIKPAQRGVWVRVGSMNSGGAFNVWDPNESFRVRNCDKDRCLVDRLGETMLDWVPCPQGNEDPPKEIIEEWRREWKAAIDDANAMRMFGKYSRTSRQSVPQPKKQMSATSAALVYSSQEKAPSLPSIPGESGSSTMKLTPRTSNNPNFLAPPDRDISHKALMPQGPRVQVKKTSQTSQTSKTSDPQQNT